MLHVSPIPAEIWTEVGASPQGGAIVSAPLARLAGQLDDVFEIKPPDAPGLSFVGAMIRVNGTSEAPGSAQILSCGGIDQSFWQAAASCLGEAAERLALRASLATERLRCRPQLEEALGPQGAAELLTLAGASGSEDETDCVVASILGTTSVLSVPSSLISMSAALPAAMNVSVGCAAGLTRRDAINRALFEWVERDAVAQWWHGGHPARQVSLETLDEAGVLTLISQARASAKGRHCWFLDITTDLAIPAIACVSWTADGKGFVHGSASRATLGEAARAAFLEACQMEVSFHLLAMKLHDRKRPLAAADRHHLARFDQITPERFPLLLPQRSPRWPSKSEGEWLAAEGIADRLGAHGMRCLCVDLHPPGIAVPVVKTFVTGLQPLPSQVATSRLGRREGGEVGVPMSLPLF